MQYQHYRPVRHQVPFRAHTPAGMDEAGQRILRLGKGITFCGAHGRWKGDEYNPLESHRGVSIGWRLFIHDSRSARFASVSAN